MVGSWRTRKNEKVGHSKSIAVSDYADMLLSCMGLLGSEWILTQFSRVEDSVSVTSQIRLIQESDVAQGGFIGSQKKKGRIFLPKTHVGSPSYWRHAALNGQHLTVALGAPTYFLAMTCNPH